MTPQELDALTDEEFINRRNQQPLSDYYFEMMRWVWSKEPWKDAPGGWLWEEVMRGYAGLKEMEAQGELDPTEY